MKLAFVFVRKDRLVVMKCLCEFDFRLQQRWVSEHQSHIDSTLRRLYVKERIEAE